MPFAPQLPSADCSGFPLPREPGPAGRHSFTDASHAGDGRAGGGAVRHAGSQTSLSPCRREAIRCDASTPRPHRLLRIAMATLLEPLSPDDVTVSTSDILVATARMRDPLVDESVTKALRLLREMLKIDAVFVAERIDGHRAIRACGTVDSTPGDLADVIPLEQACCRLVLDGKLPGFKPDLEALARDVEPAGRYPGPFSHVMTPVVLKDGRIYGTLGCLSSSARESDQQRALLNLRRSAKFVADALDRTTMH